MRQLAPDAFLIVVSSVSLLVRLGVQEIIPNRLAKVNAAVLLYFPTKTSPPVSRHGLALALLHFFDELFDRVHIHPIGAIDEGKTVFIAFRPAVAARNFILGNIDAQ
jgi:hypothetical protein